MIDRLFLGRQTWVWGALMIVTAASWLSGHEISSARLADSVILLIAFIKVRVVICEFMEVRTAPPWLRIATDAWVVLAFTLLIGLMLRAR